MDALRDIPMHLVGYLREVTPIFTADLAGPTFETWFSTTEPALQSLAQYAGHQGEQAMFILIRMLLGPTVLEGLARRRVQDWATLVQYLKKSYPMDRWGNHYADRLTQGTLFQGMEIEDAATLAIDVTWYLGAASIWAVRVAEAFLVQFSPALVNAPNDLFDTEGITAQNLPEFLDHAAQAAKLAKKRQEYMRKYVAPSPTRLSTPAPHAPTTTEGAKPSQPKSTKFQRMRDRALRAEAKLAVQEKGDTKAGNA
ncbi:hypothetical protein IWQ60_005150 [Tieghemiomyces parasiticus]|uniref:Uncharacterized protein n=1 Tax=Tieghemiomyces parasiticus TaxID=78921 RepID=A0A9W8DZ47_9FUNG|nr:hypothetical protein IWQ60_005150 [Tieghemiomyces parasiticus]